MDGRVRVSYSIGEVARASELSVKAIRYYEEIGLIPKATRTNGAMHTVARRVYREADIGRLRFIKKHLQSIDQRIGHLIGLRTAIAGLVSRPHGATATCCTWETCDCMRQNGNADRSSGMAVTQNSKHGGKYV